MDSLTKLRRIEIHDLYFFFIVMINQTCKMHSKKVKANEQYVKENKLTYSDLSPALLCKHFT